MNPFNLILLLMIWMPLHAAIQVKSNAESIIQEIKLNISPIQKIPKALKKAAIDHKNSSVSLKKLRVCEVCHQKTAHETNLFLPILHGQNRAYLESKILLFKNNKRSFHPFSARFENLTASDISFITDFYSNKSSRLTQSLIVKDFLFDDRISQHSLSECTACHGINGNGEELVPAISGQNTRYLAYRIREINNHSSSIHIDKNLDINCQIEQISLIKSNRLAKILSYVSTNANLEQGKETYLNHCIACHKKTPNGLERTSLLKQSINNQSQKNYLKKIIYHKNTTLFDTSFEELSRKKWNNAINYLINIATESP